MPHSLLHLKDAYHCNRTCTLLLSLFLLSSSESSPKPSLFCVVSSGQEHIELQPGLVHRNIFSEQKTGSNNSVTLTNE